MINKDDLTAALRKRAFDRRTKNELPFIAVGDKPIPFYARPFTIGDTHKYGDRLEKGDAKAIVELFVEKAEDEAGNKLFGKEMIQVFLDTLESHELVGLSNSLYTPINDEEALGNSAGIPSED